MEKRRVLLLCAQPLFGEGLKTMLGKLEGVELVGPWAPDATVLARLSAEDPDIVLIAEEEHESWVSWTTQILEQHPGLPVIQIRSGGDDVRLYVSRTLPARIADVIEIIQDVLPLQ